MGEKGNAPFLFVSLPRTYVRPWQCVSPAPRLEFVGSFLDLRPRKSCSCVEAFEFFSA